MKGTRTKYLAGCIFLLLLGLLSACKQTADTKTATSPSKETAVPSDACEVDSEYVSVKGHQFRDRSAETLQKMFRAGKKKDFEAFMATAADPYIQHSPDLADGMKPVWDLLANRPAGFSNKQIQWLGDKGFLDNGDYLLMLREVDRGDGTGLSKIVDIMKFDDTGKYSEHWDIRQRLAEKSKSGNSETSTAQKFIDNPVSYSTAIEEQNKRKAIEYINDAWNNGNLPEALSQFADPNYVQHNPMIPNGTKPLIAAFKSGKMGSHCYDIKQVFAQNDLVMIYSKLTERDKINAVVDIFRMREGKMVEHWDIVQKVPSEKDMPHKNTMF